MVVYFTGLYGRLENVCKTPRLEPGNSKQSLNLHPILFPPWKPTFSSFLVFVLCYSSFPLFPRSPPPRPFSCSHTLACLTSFSRHSFTAPLLPRPSELAKLVQHLNLSDGREWKVRKREWDGAASVLLPFTPTFTAREPPPWSSRRWADMGIQLLGFTCHLCPQVR